MTELVKRSKELDQSRMLKIESMTGSKEKYYKEIHFIEVTKYGVIAVWIDRNLRMVIVNDGKSAKNTRYWSEAEFDKALEKLEKKFEDARE